MLFPTAAHLQQRRARKENECPIAISEQQKQEGNMNTRYLAAIAFLLSGCIPGSIDKTSQPDNTFEITSDIEPLAVSAKVKDPGPRAGQAGAGGPVAGLNEAEQTFFRAAREVFREIDSVSGKIEAGRGLGPTFNANSCASCHAQPDVGGTSPHPSLGQLRAPNPQVALAALDRIAGGTQSIPSFVTVDGPVREARFVRN